MDEERKNRFVWEEGDIKIIPPPQRIQKTTTQPAEKDDSSAKKGTPDAKL